MEAHQHRCTEVRPNVSRDTDSERSGRAADVLLDGIVDGRDVVGLGRRRNDVRLLEDALYSRDEWLVSDEWLAGWLDG